MDGWKDWEIHKGINFGWDHKGERIFNSNFALLSDWEVALIISHGWEECPFNCPTRELSALSDRGRNNYEFKGSMYFYLIRGEVDEPGIGQFESRLI